MVSGSFHFPSRVLCSLRSRYYCAIGLGTCLGFEVGAPDSHAISNACYSGYPQSPYAPSLTGLSPSTVPRSSGLQVTRLGVRGSTTPQLHCLSTTDSDCPVPFSIAFTNGISLISFPLPTKMLQFGRLPFPKGMPRERGRMSNSAVHGSTSPCDYPWHFAAWHDLRRRPSCEMPRVVARRR